MILNTVINSVLIMGFLIGIGYFLERKGIITLDVEEAFTFMLLNIAIPALVINAFNIKYSAEKLKLGLIVMFIGFMYTLLLVVLNNLIMRNIKNEGKKRILIYSGILTNAGFMGFPVVYQIYGVEGAFFASMFYIPVMFYMWTYGMSIFYDKIGSSEIKSMLLNPNMVSVYIGVVIFIFSIDIPLLGERMLETVGGITTPLAMFIIGARIGKVDIVEIFKDRLIYLGTFLRLIFFPILMIVILSFVELNPVIEGVCLIYSALPPPAITVVIASKFNCEVDFASKLIVFTHMFSLITIPLMFALFDSLQSFV